MTSTQKDYINAVQYWRKRAKEAELKLTESIQVLKPFSDMSKVGDQNPKDEAVWAGQSGKVITYGDFRKANLLLTSCEELVKEVLDE